MCRDVLFFVVGEVVSSRLCLAVQQCHSATTRSAHHGHKTGGSQIHSCFVISCDFLIFDFCFFFDLLVRFCCVTFVPQARTSVHRALMLMFLLVFPVVVLFCPNAEDARRKGGFQAQATGLALDNNALSALHREKKKADHTPHDHTSHVCTPRSPVPRVARALLRMCVCHTRNSHMEHRL